MANNTISPRLSRIGEGHLSFHKLSQIFKDRMNPAISADVKCMSKRTMIIAHAREGITYQVFFKSIGKHVNISAQNLLDCTDFSCHFFF